MTEQQKMTWWNGFCYAMKIAGMPIASGAAVWKAMGGSISAVVRTLGTIVTSLKNFRSISQTSASIAEWVIWIAKNDPKILAKVKILFPTIAETISARGAAASLILKPGTMAQAGRVTLGTSAKASIGGTATVAALIGWTIGSIAYGYMEVYDLNKRLGDLTGLNDAWAAYYREMGQYQSHGFWANWYGVPEREQETNIMKLKMAKREQANLAALQSNVSLDGKHLSLLSSSIAKG